MEDLDSLWRYHEQVFRSFESQLGALIESHQKAEGRLDHVEASMQASTERLDRVEKILEAVAGRTEALEVYTRRAVELDIRAYRRERHRRRKEIQESEERNEKRRGAERAEWQARMGRIERNLDRWLEGLQGPNGRRRRPKGR